MSARVEGKDDRGRMGPTERIAFGASDESWEAAFIAADAWIREHGAAHGIALPTTPATSKEP